MQRSAIFHELWQQSFAHFAKRPQIHIAGAGVSGLHLAFFLAQRGLPVVVHEPARCGGLRIPLVFACHSLRRRHVLWETAADFSRHWYAQCADGRIVRIHQHEGKSYFTIHLRHYLRWLRAQVAKFGVRFSMGKASLDYTPLFVAAGSASLDFAHNFRAALFQLPGWESYFRLARAEQIIPNTVLDRGAKYLQHGLRAAIIHPKNSSQDAAYQLAKSLHPTARHALFHGERLTTRDRNPVVGFALNDRITDFRALARHLKQKQPVLCETVFFFTAMGYHAMTYTPFLADRTARWLIGENIAEENLLGMLTPARFLPP
ncbi:MAG: hypothetical protein N2Z22_04590 [Turneriella sp.]|nr:hypothetical protein [Turneriella sp.]